MDYKFSQDVFDWNLYALIYVYNPQLSCVINIGYCSFGVDKETLTDQNTITKENNKFKTLYDSVLSAGQLSLTTTCGIYKSKLAMFLLEKQHIREVNYSVWDKYFMDFVDKNDIKIL